MIESVKNETKPKEAQIYHQGLIKILVKHQVRTQGITWNDFLVQNQHEEQAIEEQYKTYEETRGIMNSPLYPRTRSKKKHNTIMFEKEA